MFLRRVFLLLMVLLALLALGAGGLAWWAGQPLTMRLSSATATLDLPIPKGSSARSVAQAVADSGVDVDPDVLYAWFRLSGDARKIKAGSYEVKAGDTPRSLLSRLTRGEEALRRFVLVEGWNFRQVREQLRQAEHLKADSLALSDAEIMERLGRPSVPAEGRFFPDTYAYAKGSSDLALLERAAVAMDQQLASAWGQRASRIAVQTPEQALTLASIVEKETGQASDRAMISGVFHNRLRIGMLLQTDPTVIYGLGSRYGGRLRKVDLQTDTPWNTYTRAGLPPTPIAMPGKAALLAAVQPASSSALYFVARGDGSSQFSEDLTAHNRAVDQYIRSRKDPGNDTDKDPHP